MEARLETKDALLKTELEAKDAKMAALTAPEPEAISEEDLSSLQARFEGLHVTQLLADEVRASHCKQLNRRLSLTACARRTCTRWRTWWLTTCSSSFQ